MTHRIEQINTLLQEQINNFLLSNFETPLGTLVTITRVEATPDFHEARAYVSVLPESQRGSILEGLRKTVPALQQSLYHDLTIHSTPRIHFAIDEAERRAAEAENLLDSLKGTG